MRSAILPTRKLVMSSARVLDHCLVSTSRNSVLMTLSELESSSKATSSSSKCRSWMIVEVKRTRDHPWSCWSASNSAVREQAEVNSSDWSELTSYLNSPFIRLKSDLVRLSFKAASSSAILSVAANSFSFSVSRTLRSFWSCCSIRSNWGRAPGIPFERFPLICSLQVARGGVSIDHRTRDRNWKLALVPRCRREVERALRVDLRCSLTVLHRALAQPSTRRREQRVFPEERESRYWSRIARVQLDPARDLDFQHSIRQCRAEARRKRTCWSSSRLCCIAVMIWSRFWFLVPFHSTCPWTKWNNLIWANWFCGASIENY